MKIKYLVLIIILLVGSLFYCVYTSNQQSTQVVPESDQSITNFKDETVWNTFNDNIHHFSFEYPQGTDVNVEDGQENNIYYYLENHYSEIKDTDSNLKPDLYKLSNYWIFFYLYQKDTSTEMSCNSLFNKENTNEEGSDRSDFSYTDTKESLNGYEVYKRVANIDRNDDVRFLSVCFERPNYTLFIHGSGDTYRGYNVIEHLTSNIKFY